MARWKLIEREARSLVSSLGGSQMGDENFQLCVDFSLRNFKYNNFLDTDEKKVEKIIQGIYDKLIIHNLQSKAELFKEYCQLFLSGPLSKDNIEGNTALHYSLLHLLLLTSHSPTEDKVSYDRNVTSKGKQSSYQKFDWKAYLLDCEDNLNDFHVYDKSDGEEEDYDDLVISEIVGDKGGHRDVNPHQTGINIEAKKEDDDVADDSKGVACIQKEINENQERMLKSGEWLQNHISTSYWSGSVRHDGLTNHLKVQSGKSSGLLSNWNDFLSSSSCIDLTKNQNLLTEYQVVREVLWLLNGFDKLFVFHWDGFKYQVNKDVVVSHLAESSLHHLLEEASSFGSMVRGLKEFVETTSHRILLHSDSSLDDKGFDNCGGDIRKLFSSSINSQSHQAFSAAIHSQLKCILSRFVEVIKEVLKQDDMITLSRLMLILEPQFKSISILYYFLIEGIIGPQLHHSSSTSSTSCLNHTIISKFIESITKISRNFTQFSFLSSPSPPSSSPSKLTSHLLNTIYGCLVMADQSTAFKDHEMDLIVQVWMETCRPYLEMLDAWLNCSIFLDPCDEFFIKRNKNWETLGENFWNDAVFVEKEEHASLIFLEPVIKEVIVTGKSFKLLEGITDQVKADSLSPHKISKTLYQLYSASLMESYGEDDGYDSDDIKNGKQVNKFDFRKSSKIESISRFLKGLHQTYSPDLTFVDMLKLKLKQSDPLLLCSLLNLIPSSEINAKETSHDKSTSPLPMRRKNSSLQMTLNRVVEEYVQSRYLSTSSRLLQVMRDEHHLHCYVSFIKKYFLMESGRIMFDFYTSLFKAMNSGEEWFQEGYLKFVLCESLRDESAEELDRISITVKNLKDPSTSIHCLESITMDYKPPWPCNMVINSSSMAHYSDIFKFLLQIKWAKYSLDCLRFSDLRDSKTNKGSMHWMFIFKMKVLHFVNSFHNYIMTRIIHSAGLEFQSRFDSSSDFDDLIATHSAYVQTLSDRCLLHEKVHLIKKLVLKVLQMALDVSRMWTTADICETKLTEMEMDFNRCLQFLSSLVNQVVARGSLAHLELLAFTFLSCIDSSKSK